MATVRHRQGGGFFASYLWPFDELIFMAMRLLCAAAVLAFASMLAASAAWSFPWDIDMYRGATVRPLTEAPRVMPAGTLPATGGELPMTRVEMTANEHNPLQPTPENLAAGKSLYATNCAPCHGTSGTGDGTVAHLLKTKPKDIANGVSKHLPDGYLYGTIRAGGVTMPAYADAMSAHERWQLVIFVRSLQNAGVAGK
jgi:mono/diheme cytochrome c family protein